MALLGTLADHRARRALFLLGAAALLLAGLVTWKAHEMARESVSAQLARSAALERRLLVDELARHVDLVLAARGALPEDGRQDQAALDRLESAVDFEDRYPALQSLVVVERLDESGRRALRGALEVRPSGRRPEYRPVVAAVPQAGNETALGFDVGTNPQARPAQDRAAATGLPSLSGRLRLAQEEGNQFGFTLYVPYLHGDGPVAEEGWVGLAFRADDYVDAVFGGLERAVGVRIFDGAAEAGDEITAWPPALRAAPDPPGEPVIESTVELYGQEWTLRFVGLPPLDAARVGRTTAATAAVATLLAVGAVVGLALLLARLESGREVEALADALRADPLTGLPNRLVLDERLHEVRARRARDGRQLGLLFLDLDGFKQVNDEHGHRTGDLLLSEIAHVLRDACRASELAVRLGGDEFVVLLEVADPATAARAGERLREALERSYPIEGQDLHVQVSVGSVAATADDAETDRLLGRADHAMYEAKRRRAGPRSH